MKKEKNNNIVIILLCIIILILIVLLCLIATGTISLGSSTIKDNNQTTNTEEKTTQEENKYIINYKEEEYTTKREDGTQVSNSKRNIPEITNKANQNAADKIADYLTKVSNKDWEESIKKTADEVTKGGIPYNDLGVSYFYQTGLITKNSLTFLLEMNGGFGGVSWASKQGFNFNSQTGDILSLSDITKDDASREYIFNKVYNYLDKESSNENNCLFDDYKEKAKEEIAKEGNWYFTEYDLVIVLQKYSVACGAAGVKEINIPKDEINNYLKDEYKI